MEIIDGCLWVTYTDDPENPVNIGSVWQNPPVVEHIFTEWLVIKEQTCTVSGIKQRYCTECGHTETKTIVSNGHTVVIDQGIEATCTETGLTEGSHCSVCDEILVAQMVVDVLGHSEIIDEAVAPTCTETGLTEGKHCGVCGEILVAQKIVAAIGHTEVIDEAVAPTCTKTGLTEGQHCSVCGEIFVAQEIIPATGTHNYTSVMTPPTATEDGYKTYTCVCGDTYTETITPTSFTVTNENRAMVGYTGVENENLVIPAVFENEGTWYRVTRIENEAFSYCNVLMNVVVPNTVTSIGQSAFAHCSSLVSITLPQSMTSLSSNAFAYCAKLVSVSIPDGVTKIMGSTFEECSKLTNIVVSNSVKTIRSGVFSSTSALANVYYKGTQEEWNAISIEDNNTYLTGSATIYYYSETEPTSEGNFWHYVNGVPTVWESPATELFAPI